MDAKAKKQGSLSTKIIPVQLVVVLLATGLSAAFSAMHTSHKRFWGIAVLFAVALCSVGAQRVDDRKGSVVPIEASLNQ